MAAQQPLPPGIYFNPLPEECVRDYLMPWIESDCDDGTRAPPRHGAVFPVEVYQHSSSELRQMFPPGHARRFDNKWYFLTLRESYGSHGRRCVATGGNWKVEQKTKDVDGGGKRRTYGFYIPDGHKKPWLMEELAAAADSGDKGSWSSMSVPVLCKIYVSPRTGDGDRRAILGDAIVACWSSP